MRRSALGVLQSKSCQQRKTKKGQLSSLSWTWQRRMHKFTCRIQAAWLWLYCSLNLWYSLWSWVPAPTHWKTTLQRKTLELSSGRYRLNFRDFSFAWYWLWTSHCCSGPKLLSNGKKRSRISELKHIPVFAPCHYRHAPHIGRVSAVSAQQLWPALKRTLHILDY